MDVAREKLALSNHSGFTSTNIRANMTFSYYVYCEVFGFDSEVCYTIYVTNVVTKKRTLLVILNKYIHEWKSKFSTLNWQSYLCVFAINSNTNLKSLLTAIQLLTSFLYIYNVTSRASAVGLYTHIYSYIYNINWYTEYVF